MNLLALGTYVAIYHAHAFRHSVSSLITSEGYQSPLNVSSLAELAQSDTLTSEGVRKAAQRLQMDISLADEYGLDARLPGLAKQDMGRVLVKPPQGMPPEQHGFQKHRASYGSAASSHEQIMLHNAEALKSLHQEFYRRHPGNRHQYVLPEGFPTWTFKDYSSGANTDRNASAFEVLRTVDIQREDGKERGGVSLKGFDAQLPSEHFPVLAMQRQVAPPLAVRYRDRIGWRKFAIYPWKAQPDAVYNEYEALYTIKETRYKDYAVGLDEFAIFPGYCKSNLFGIRKCNDVGKSHPSPSMYVACKAIDLDVSSDDLTVKPNWNSGSECKVTNVPFSTQMRDRYKQFKNLGYHIVSDARNNIMVGVDVEAAKNKQKTLLVLLVAQALAPVFQLGEPVEDLED